MKKLLLFLLLFGAYILPSAAQINQAQPKYLGKRATAPASCTTTGSYYYSTAESKYLYCTVTGTPGTWVSVGGSTGSSLAPNAAALRFDGTRVAPNGHNVNFGAFWKTGVNYGNAYWDFLFRPFFPNQNGGYVISAGYTASHVILVGYDSNDTMFRISGNMYIAGGLVPFSTPMKFRLGGWYHIAVVRDGDFIKIYVNGLCESRTFAAGFRTAPSTLETVLYVGGSDHNNATFDLLWLRGVEGDSVIENVGFNQSFRPQRYPISTFYRGAVQGDVIKSNFLADFSYPRQYISDDSSGLTTAGVTEFHSGSRSVGTGGFTADEIDLPQWVPAVVGKPVKTDTIVIDPLAKISDSFSSNNLIDRERTPFWDKNPGLGQTEGGTQGIKTWVVTGIGAGYAVSDGWVQPYISSGGTAVVSYNSADYDIRLNKSGDVTVLGNYVDSNNYLSVSYGADTNLVITKRIAGTDTQLFSGQVGTQQDVLRVVKSGINVDVYSGFNLVQQVTNATGLSSGAVGFSLSTFNLGKINEFAVF